MRLPYALALAVPRPLLEPRVVTRRQKLLAAGIVLAVGFGLAWPLRRTGPLIPASARLESAPVEAQALTQGVDLDQPVKPAAPLASVPAASGRDPFAAATPPVYSTVSAVTSNTPLAEVPPAEQIHVVHEGDSLDRLAKRYLGDESRALEIFDLNRAVLDNPHLLRIGAELRIPSDGSVAED